METPITEKTLDAFPVIVLLLQKVPLCIPATCVCIFIELEYQND